MLTIRDEPIPIKLNEHGVARVGGTRVTLTTVITAYMLGSTPEQITEDYPTLKLDDVYATITYYLRHQAEVDDYLELQVAMAEELRQEIEKHFPQMLTRQRLLARKKRLEGK